MIGRLDEYWEEDKITPITNNNVLLCENQEDFDYDFNYDSHINNSSIITMILVVSMTTTIPVIMIKSCCIVILLFDAIYIRASNLFQCHYVVSDLDNNSICVYALSTYHKE